MKKESAQRRVIVTGGAGFIGVNLVRHLLNEGYEVLNFDKLTYAGNLASLRDCEGNPHYHFIRGDVADRNHIAEVIREFQPDRIFHLAAESHVDRSIESPLDFIQTNVFGTACLLDAALDHWIKLSDEQKSDFQLIHLSTDEVFGSLDRDELFHEGSPYCPRSPYSASKAGSDHLMRAWNITYGLPTVVVNSSNNYGAYQFPEKLIPVAIVGAISENKISIYGNGENLRDWLHVDDHCTALIKISAHGRAGERYVVGGGTELRNIDLIRQILTLVEKVSGDYGKEISGTESLIQFVEDRPGHDFRYGVNSQKLQADLGWKPKVDFANGLESTVRWYFENQAWWKAILDNSYRQRTFE
jgi:dTDP-glucose 4,6-dehydratase